MAAGTRLGPYELQALLGAGGMGEVYRARDSRLERTVAVKLLPPALATPRRLARFEREARAASALSHPNIVTIYDVGRESGTPYIAMEWVEGETLRALMDGPRLPMPRIVAIAAQIADGLARAHDAGIVHCDIKPENVMLAADGLAKIVDFGVARLTAGDGDDCEQVRVVGTGTATGHGGTLVYMSPEHAAGLAIDHRSDQFALGVVLYEMTTRRRPFEGTTPAEWVAAIVGAAPAPVEVLAPLVPRRLANVIARCLQRSPDERYESTRDLAVELRLVLDEVSAWDRTGGASGVPAFRQRMALVVLALALATSTPGSVLPPDASAGQRTVTPLVAVRGFQDLSPDSSLSVVATTMTDDIHDALSRLSGLRILSRGAVDRLGDTGAERVADELAVTNLIEGSVRVVGGRAHTTVALIDVRTEQTLFTQSYDSAIVDATALQNDVVLNVTRALHATLTSPEQARAAATLTTNRAALERFRHWQRHRNDWHDGATRAASLAPLREAIALDPDFSVARAALSYELVLIGGTYDRGGRHLEAGVAEAEEALRRAPTLARPHVALASAAALKGRASQARLSFQRALALDPNNVSAMYNLSVLETSVGRLAEALAWARAGFERSGRRANDVYHLAYPLVRLRDDDLSWRFLSESEQRLPGPTRFQEEMSLAALFRGDAVGALDRIRRLAESPPGDDPESLQLRAEMAYLVGAQGMAPWTEALMEDFAGAPSAWLGVSQRVRLAYVKSRSGDRASTAAMLDLAARLARDRIDGGDESPIWRTELAAIAALRGEVDEALDALDRAYDAGYREYGLLERDPILAPLRDNPRFSAVLDRMRRDVAEQRQAARERGHLDLDALIRPRRTGIRAPLASRR